MTIPPLIIVKKGSNAGPSLRRASKIDVISAMSSSPFVKRKEMAIRPGKLDSETNSILPFVDKDLPPAPLLLVDKASVLPFVRTADSSSLSPARQEQESPCHTLSRTTKSRSLVPFLDEENLLLHPLLSVGVKTAGTRHLSMQIVKPPIRTAEKENIPPLIVIKSKRTSTPPLSLTKKRQLATETIALCDVTDTKKSWEVFRARGAVRKELGPLCLVRNDGEEIL